MSGKIYLISYVVNIVLNYILIFGKLGSLDLGVTGAAVGTLIVRIIEFLIISIHILNMKTS